MRSVIIQAQMTPGGSNEPSRRLLQRIDKVGWSYWNNVSLASLAPASRSPVVFLSQIPRSPLSIHRLLATE